MLEYHGFVLSGILRGGIKSSILESCLAAFDLQSTLVDSLVSKQLDTR